MHVIIISGGIKSYVHPIPVLLAIFYLLAISTKMNTRSHVTCIILFRMMQFHHTNVVTVVEQYHFLDV